MPNQFGLTDKFRVAAVDETHQIMREACRRIDADSLEIPQFAKVRIERLIETLDKLKSEGITPSSLVSADGRFKNKTLQNTDLEVLVEYEPRISEDKLNKT